MPAGETANGVTALSAGEGVLAYFWDLASLDEDTRTTAARSLVQELAFNQAEYERDGAAVAVAAAAGNAAGPAKDKQTAKALERCCPLVVYGVKRLCRGLSSSRQGARQGFALALASLLESVRCIAPAGMLTVLAAVLEPSLSTKGSDARDALLGLLFGYGAVVRGSPELDGDAVQRLATAILELSARKSFLREAAAAILVELAARIDDDALAALLQVEDVRAWLTAAPEESSPEALLFALRLWHRLPVDVRAECLWLPTGAAAPPAALFQSVGRPNGDADVAAAADAAAAFFAERHLRVILPALRTSTHSHPRLHSVWPTLLALLLPEFTLDKDQRSRDAGAAHKRAVSVPALHALWSVSIEDDIFQSASHERKYLGFTLLTLLLPHLGPEHVGVVFTPNFLRTLSNNLCKADTYLHAAAKKCVDRISTFMEKSGPEVRVAVAVALQRHGGAAFARLARMKAGGKVSEELDAAGLQAYVEQLEGKFAHGEGEQEDEEDVIRRQQWAVEQLQGVLKQAETALDVKLGVLKFLAVRAFFATEPTSAVKGKPKPSKAAAPKLVDVALPTRHLCASRLIALADSLSRPTPQQAAKGKDDVAAGGAAPRQPAVDCLGEVAAYAESLKDAGAASAYDVVEAADQASACLSQLRTSLAQHIAAAGQSAAGVDGRAAQLRPLHHLVCLLELHTLGNPSTADADAANDLQRACAEVAGGSSGHCDEEGPHWMDTLVDVLLSLLAQSYAPLPSAPLRDAAERVFRAFSEHLTATGVADLVRVIAQPMEGSGEEPSVFEGNSDGDGGSSDGGSSESGSDDEDASDEDGQSGSDEDQEMVIASEPGDGADNATDEQMFRMDAKLGAYFSTMRDARTGAKSNRQELVNFKMRVLALLESFIKKAPTSPLLLAVPIPLLTALSAASKPGGDRVLAERLAGVLHRLCKSRPEGSAADLEDLPVQLRRALYLATRSTNKGVLGAAAAVYIYLQKAAIMGQESVAALSAAATESAAAMVADFFEKKKCRLSRAALVEFMRRLPVLAAAVLPQLLDRAVGARTEYLRGEAYALVDVALKVNASALPAVMVGNAEGLAEALAAAVSCPAFVKPKLHIEALKAACRAVEGMAQKCGGARAVLGASAVDALCDSARAAAGGHAKVDGQLKRLADLLLAGDAGQAGSKGKRKDPAAAAASDGKKRRKERGGRLAA